MALYGAEVGDYIPAMFTGLVEAKGVLAKRTRSGSAGGARLFVEAPFGPLVLGESIATDGVCLTVEAIESGAPRGFWATASSETLAKTTLGEKKLGSPVNLERAVAAGARLGGHIVSGHVDGVGRVEAVRPEGGGTRVSFTYPVGLARFVAEKGAVTINGVSLTVNGVSPARVDPGSPSFHVMLVPYTQGATAWELESGTPVNIEVDVLARYVARLLEVGAPSPEQGTTPSSDEAWLARLSGGGFLR